MTAVARMNKPALAGTLLLSGLLAWPAPSSAMLLSEAIAAALKNDPAIAVARAQYDADRQAGTIERAELLPTLDLKATGAYASTTLEGTFGEANQDSGGVVKDKYTEWSARAEVRQPLLRFDFFDRLSRARASDKLAEIGLVDAQSTVIARAAGAYLEVELAQDLLVQAEAEAKAVRRSLEDTRHRFEVGLIPGTDAKEAQARDDLAQARLIAAHRSLAESLEVFAEATGTPVARLPRVREDASFGLPQPADAEAWVKIATENRPSLVTAQLAVEVARADAESSRARGLPALDAVASSGRKDSSDYRLGQIADDTRIGVELTIPLYAGGGNQAQNRRADALYAARKAEFARLQQETAREIRRLYRRAETGVNEVKAYRRSADSAIAAETATRNGYDAGTRTITDLLDAQSRVAQANRDWNIARFNLVSDLIALKRVAGTLAAQDFLDLDRLLEPLPATAQNETDDAIADGALPTAAATP